MANAKNTIPDRKISTHATIRMALIARGIRMSEIARKVGYAPSYVTMVAQGERHNKRIQAALCRATGIRRRELWT